MYGFEERSSSGSHFTFTKTGRKPINIPKKGGQVVKRSYLKAIAKELDL